ncbi:fimbrial protein [Atlantibacter hermannii]|uniref:fimbrial protein n=1 Tax=Atlantibacter hermannii TaxID=565 RepID=UPI0022B79C25|nr:fimbrial protein [Atlantibacter hermannii]MCZ7834721.1 fimbrial protein [Atlantibacter hermannii]
MKKLYLAISTLFMAAATHAATNDVSATLAITGSITPSESTCTVTLEQPVMQLGAHDIKDLPDQGHYNWSSSGYTNTINLVGDGCVDKTGSDLGLAISFKGPADSSVGDSFINTAQGDDAAKGIGVGIYDYAKNPIEANTGTRPTYKNQMLFSAGLVKLKGETYSAGKVDSSITVEIDRL